MTLSNEIFHDMTPQFLKPAQADPGDTVSITLRTGVEDVVSVDLICLVVEDGEDTEQGVISIREPMVKLRTEQKDFYYWRAQRKLTDAPLDYFFEIHYPLQKLSYDRLGLMRTDRERVCFRIIPGFHTPAWAEGAVMYQIFTDRFCNGDRSNDVLDGEYFYNGQPTVRIADWTRLPSATGGDIREFYGGDLQGVIERLDYLKDLGIEVIYFNPLFCSPSTHKYDTQDYAHIDPHFGRVITDGPPPMRYVTRLSSRENLDASDALFALLVQKAHERGIRVIIDGVFNHCGSFNKWMDRERIYENAPGYEKGAYISRESPYHDYFTFTRDAWPYNPHYEGWWGYDTLPKLNYEGSERLAEEILAIARKWVSAPYCADGWRLDVAADLGHSEAYNHSFWRRFRRAVKEANPEAIIIAEHYGDAGPWLQGGEWDTVMNYDAFMEPVSYFFTGMEKHSDAFEPGAVGNEDRFWDTMSYRAARNFPQGSLYSAMNELSNHDHSRFLTRTNGKVGRVSTLGHAAASEGVDPTVFRQAVLVQMTWPGAPTVYYGDEAGVCGFTDPDNRRTYPWGREDLKLLAFHKDVIRIHRENEELRHGSLLRLKSERGVLAYGRFIKDAACVILINRNEYTVTDDYEVHVLGVPRKAVVRNLLMTGSAGYHTVAEERFVKDGLLTVTLPKKSGMIFKYARGISHDPENFLAHGRRLNFT